ncbi:MAG TPA: hypothetical protein VFU19_02685, partial [Iamia sp.]|nr:hypothetical protein [Iamia sp.]
MGGDRVMVERLLGFEVDEDPEVPLGFRDRLARENGWSPAHAGRVYDEYRRFLVLAATGTEPVTPSDEVDQAWHLHLTYTRSYWDRLCGEVLGRPLHHGPTTGTHDDGTRYRRQYQTTLDRYRAVFGAEPPADVWPSVGERFRDPARWRRVDTRAHLVVRRAPLVAAGAAGLAVAGTTAATARTDDAEGLILVIGVVVVIVIVAAVVLGAATRRAYRAGRSGAPRPRRSGGGAGGAGFFGAGGGSDSGG